MLISTECPSCVKIFLLCNKCGRPQGNDEKHFCSHCGESYEPDKDFSNKAVAERLVKAGVPLMPDKKKRDDEKL